MKLFSPEKANALIPVLTPMVEELWAKRRELAIRLLEQDPALRPPRRGAASGGERRAEARRCTELKAEIVRTINRIESYGCVVKDLELGTARFPGAARRAPGTSLLEDRRSRRSSTGTGPTKRSSTAKTSERVPRAAG